MIFFVFTFSYKFPEITLSNKYAKTNKVNCIAPEIGNYVDYHKTATIKKTMKYILQEYSIHLECLVTKHDRQRYGLLSQELQKVDTFFAFFYATLDPSFVNLFRNTQHISYENLSLSLPLLIRSAVNQRKQNSLNCFSLVSVFQMDYHFEERMIDSESQQSPFLICKIFVEKNEGIHYTCSCE